ncbi:MAG: YggT family protein [Limnochordia bacterium]|jgi:YggT family protein|nr:YggT family protein [Limnochordia bacterium]
MRIIALADLLFELYTWILIARFLLTWIPNVDYSHPIIQFIHKATDFVVRPFRGIIPPLGNIDISPLLMFLVLRMAYSLLRRLLFLVML